MTIDSIKFGVWAPTKEIFVQSWVDADIWSLDLETNTYVYSDGYQGIFCNMDTWPGIIVKTPGTYDSEGNELTPPELIPGWHTNVLVHGQDLLQQFTAGLEQYETVEIEGETVTRLKSLWERTHAATFFQLTYKEANLVTGFPEGYQNVDGVTYAESSTFSSPSNIIAA